jgi:hypothetical protein
LLLLRLTSNASRIQQPGDHSFEYADEINTALVDEEGDDEFERTDFYDLNEEGKWIKGLAEPRVKEGS